MQPLIDADVLIYEIGYAAEAQWRYELQEGYPPFEYAALLLDTRISNICAMVGATSPPMLFLTGKEKHDSVIKGQVGNTVFTPED